MILSPDQRIIKGLDLIVDSHSWKYIELSIRNGILEDLDKHRVGLPAGTIRDVGSIVQPAKGSRTPFTAEDDRVLYEWVEQLEDQGSATAGNVIYKQLEAKVYQNRMIHGF